MKPNRIRPLVNAGLVALLFACGGGNPTGPVVTPPSTKPPVQQQNRAPAWSSSPITFCNENASYSYVLNAPDPDGDNVTYSLIQSPSWLSISGNTLSGECPEVFRDSSFAVEISASDQKAQPVSQKYSLTAKNKFNVYVLSGSQSKSTGMNMNAADTAFTFTVNPDTSISFPYPVNFIVPDIVASGITPQTPKGLIRKIKDISSDKKRIYTEQATIEEIAKKASVPFSKQLLPSDINLSVMRSLEHMPHLYSPQNTLAGFNFGLPINETIEGVTISGDIYFNLSLDVQIDIDWFTLKNFSFKQTLSDVSNLRISSNIFGAALSKEVSLLTIPFNPITIGVIKLSDMPWAIRPNVPMLQGQIIIVS